MKKFILTGIISLVLLTAFVTVTAKTIYIDQLGTDEQYSYNHDYSGSVVALTYNEINSKFIGQISATGLKPYATYQVKFSGKPTCNYSDGNDLANEYIGLKGRWTCIDCMGTASERNRNDAQYYAKSHFRGDGLECIQGYLVFDFFTTDANGNAEKMIEASNSYHVLWCGGGICNSVNNNYLYKPDSEHPSTFFCPADKVDGQIERGVCGGLILSNGNYDLIISLTEESFHQGNWATVLEKNITFEILETTTTTMPTTISTTITTSTTTSTMMSTTVTTTTTSIPSAVCGNGILEPGERCEKDLHCNDNNFFTIDKCVNCNCKYTSIWQFTTTTIWRPTTTIYPRPITTIWKTTTTIWKLTTTIWRPTTTIYTIPTTIIWRFTTTTIKWPF
jgi:hypothetical protein